MSITYEVLQFEGVIRETWRGEISIAMLRMHWDKMLRDDECLRHTRTLADLRQATLTFNDQELQAAVLEVAVPLLQGRDWISAIVVRRSLQLRLASRYHGFAAMYSQDAIFSQVDEAERWLVKQERRSQEPDGGRSS
jgi:hypothetical protein